jgi:disulfide oxidoreductase YuzD
MKADSYQIEENMLSVGSFYASQFSEDMEWYRVVIEAIYPNGTLCVRYVDYGNKEVVPASNIRELDSRFLTQPRMVSDVCPSAV